VVLPRLATPGEGELPPPQAAKSMPIQAAPANPAARVFLTSSFYGRAGNKAITSFQMIR
jgi:hypothetical protein